MESALSQYKSYQASLLGAQANLILSEDDYLHCKIYSPISGVIGLTNYTEGNYITPSSGVLATIVQLDPIRVKFSMSTRDYLNNFSDFSGLKSKCTVKVKLADNTFYEEEGEIEFINNEAAKSTDTVQIFTKFKNPRARLLPNNTVAVYLNEKQAGNKVSIPMAALMFDEESPYVFVLDAQAENLSHASAQILILFTFFRLNTVIRIKKNSYLQFICHKKPQKSSMSER